MPGPTPRTRLIFQNLNLFVGPFAQTGWTATGALFSTVSGQPANSGINLVAQLQSIDSATLTVAPQRADVNIYGQLQRVDQVQLNAPAVTLSFDYYQQNGYNEYMCGFDIGNQCFISGILTKASDSKNYFISISQQGVDDDSPESPLNRDCWAIGNGFISNYSFNASVGQLAKCAITVDAMNLAVYSGSSGLQTPAVDPIQSVRINTWNFALPSGAANVSAAPVFAIRPSDIVLTVPSGLGFIVPTSGSNSINLQSVAISCPINRETLNRLGSFYGFSREIRFPVDVSVQLRALQTEVQANSLDNLINNDQFYNGMTVALLSPGTGHSGPTMVTYTLNQLKMSNVSLGTTINGDATVDISATCQFGGALSQAGMIMSGQALPAGVL